MSTSPYPAGWPRQESWSRALSLIERARARQRLLAAARPVGEGLGWLPARGASRPLAGWLYGTPGGTEPPGMMVGLAGMGYGLLRLASPGDVPCVLRLADAAGQETSDETL